MFRNIFKEISEKCPLTPHTTVLINHKFMIRKTKTLPLFGNTLQSAKLSSNISLIYLKISKLALTTENGVNTFK